MSPPSIEAAARRYKRRKLVAWAVRQSITAALAAWLLPKYPWLGWTLVLVIPLALFSLYQILRWEEVADRGAELDELMRQLDEPARDD